MARASAAEVAGMPVGWTCSGRCSPRPSFTQTASRTHGGSDDAGFSAQARYARSTWSWLTPMYGFVYETDSPVSVSYRLRRVDTGGPSACLYIRAALAR